jgi:hypothetical protein
MDSAEIKILCVISTCSHEPFCSILQKGTLPSWALNAKKIKVCTLQCKYNSNVVRSIDALRERIRYKSKNLARFGQVFDLLLIPFMYFVPRFRLHSETGGVQHFEISIPEILTMYRWKYLAAFKYFLEETDSDFIYTVNASCYVNEDKLFEFLENKDIEYGGSLADDPKFKMPFISGANRLISRETVLEDVGLGRLTRRLGISPEDMPTLNIASEFDLAQVSAHQLENNFHFRLKSFSNSGEKRNRRVDVKLFNILRERLESNKNT